jgi:hypothetical protein
VSAVLSPVRSLLRLEALAASFAGLAVWVGLDGGWWRFALLILVPDISILGYAWGPRAGAVIYNAAHSYAMPLVIGVVGGVLDNRSFLLCSALWFTHIGVDRALGLGLKYSTSFNDTHLGHVGRRHFTQSLPQTLQRTGEHLTQLLNQPEASSTAPGSMNFSKTTVPS